VESGWYLIGVLISLFLDQPFMPLSIYFRIQLESSQEMGVSEDAASKKLI
jgi:hypothetical protein